MNKKGFTLVEIIVTIGLLALLGVGIGLSLTKVLKNQEENTYESFIEKVKSSTLLFSSNSATIMNDLEFNNGYVLISMDDLINAGYVRENTKNPNTNETLNELGINEKGEDYSQARIYYSMDKEMIIDYPFIKPEDDIYLNVINYTTMYKSNESDLCYKGLNTSSLGLTLVEKGGLLNKNLVAGKDIVAYMEDGSECTDQKLNTSKVGNYKIRYIYSIDGKNINTTQNTKSATRNIIITPTKPIIKKFEVTNYDTNNVYAARMTLNVSDVDKINLKYCLVATKKDQKPNINNCENSDDTFGVNKWLKVANKGVDFSNNFAIDELLSEFKNEPEVVFYTYVRNDFEEYSQSQMQNVNVIGTYTYLLTSTLKIYLNEDQSTTQVYYSDINKNKILPAIKEINGITYKTKLSTVLSENGYTAPKTSKYYFEKWIDEKGNDISLDTELVGTVIIKAKWIADSVSPKCSITAGSPLTVSSSDNESGVASSKWINLGATLSDGTHTYQVMDKAFNTGNCSIIIVSKIDHEETNTACMSTQVSCDCQDGNGWYTVSWIDYNTKEHKCQCCRNSTTTTKICPTADTYKSINNTNYCYKNV